MYAVTSIAFVRRTRATLRSAEFGFFGVCVNTRVHTPRFCGAPWSAGVFVFPCWSRRPLRTNWFTVGNACPRFFSHWVFTQQKAGMGGRPGQPLLDGSKTRAGVKTRKRVYCQTG